MVNIDTWMEGFLSRLKETFGPRLLFLGLQGSYGRGEANEDSDIDVVCVLDRVDLADLDTYRTLVRGMPEGEKACGFLCGAEELKRWPEYDLCSVVRDTRPLFGSWEGLLPPLGRADLARGVAIGASGLYHAAVHFTEGGKDGPIFCGRPTKAPSSSCGTVTSCAPGNRCGPEGNCCPGLEERRRPFWPTGWPRKGRKRPLLPGSSPGRAGFWGRISHRNKEQLKFGGDRLRKIWQANSKEKRRACHGTGERLGTVFAHRTAGGLYAVSSAERGGGEAGGRSA